MPEGGTRASILLACSEVVGFAKTGGLADVAGYLPLALARRGHPCAIVMPLYRTVRNGPVPIEPTAHVLAIPMAGRVIGARLYRATLPDSNVPVFLVEHHDYFERDAPKEGRGLYQMTQPDRSQRDYPDNCARFTFFCRAVLETVPALGFVPDVLHANDWQTGLVPVYFRELYQHRAGYKRLRTLFTIHNIAYQGTFSALDYHLTGLDRRLFNSRQLEFYGQLNFLKAGIVFSDWVNTVSPTYAREITTTYFGCGLEGVLTERRDRLSGIVNGVDYDVWNPATDPHIAQTYDAETLPAGKAACKAALQKRFGLNEEPGTPLFGMIARLVEQKGVDLVIKAAEELFARPAQLVILGEGHPDYQRKLKALQERFPKQFGLYIGFDEGLAHQIEAGSDLYLMPSLYEPSGLNQLYSLRYGTPPIVRTTGGLADTIVDTTEDTLHEGTATGFRFLPYTPQALLATIDRALDLYHHRPERFLHLRRIGMRQDWSWDRSAREYEALYQRLMAERR